MTELPRLDILLYAHDGRGLGHASRTIGIGMALRRIYPGLRVLFISGSRMSQELIGPAPLDWLKLPSYETEVIDGRSRGVQGKSMFTDRELGLLRGTQLQQLVTLYRPRLVLSDHTPQGKHRELLPALSTVKGDCQPLWVLGVRGVVGAVSQVNSVMAQEIFKKHYHALLWYGDSAILGAGHLQQLEELYGCRPIECGYVSRLSELRLLQQEREGNAGKQDAVTVSIPWLGENTLPFLRKLAKVIGEIGPEHGRWLLFIDIDGAGAVRSEVRSLFHSLPHCELEQPSGARYVRALLGSRSALIYGGYNSVMDVLSVKIPAVVVLREMEDSEQQIHLGKLKASAAHLQLVEESQVTDEELRNLLISNLDQAAPLHHAIQLGGAEHAAQLLFQMLQGQAKG